MNLTITVDDETLQKARDLAHQRGTSVQELLRAHLRELVGERPRSTVAAELVDLMKAHPGRSGGKRIRREDAYEGRV